MNALHSPDDNAPMATGASLRTPSPIAQLGRLAWLDLRLAFRDRASFFWMLILPMVFMWIFGQINYSSNPEPQIFLAVDDHDGGWLARELVLSLEGEGLEPGRLAVKRLDAEEAPAPAANTLDPGDPQKTNTPGTNAQETDSQAPVEPPPLVRVLVIPEGFTAGVLAGEVQTLHLRSRSGSSQEFSFAARTHVIRSMTSLLGRLVEAHLDVLPEDAVPDSEPLTTGGVLQQLLSAAASPTFGGTEESVAVPSAAASQELAAAVRALGQRPGLVNVRATAAGSGRPAPSGVALSVPGTLSLLVLMMTAIYGGVSLAHERQRGLLQRLATLPVSRGQLFLGKLLGRFALAMVQVVLLVAVGTLVFRLDWGPSWLGLALVFTTYAFTCAGFSLLLGALLRTPDQVASVAWISSMAMAALGGCWWPAEVMPGWMRTAGHIFPTAWAMDAFHSLISFGNGVEAVLPMVTALAGFGLVFTLIGRRYLRFD